MQRRGKIKNVFRGNRGKYRSRELDGRKDMPEKENDNASKE